RSKSLPYQRVRSTLVADAATPRLTGSPCPSYHRCHFSASSGGGRVRDAIERHRAVILASRPSRCASAKGGGRRRLAVLVRGGSWSVCGRRERGGKEATTQEIAPADPGGHPGRRLAPGGARRQPRTRRAVRRGADPHICRRHELGNVGTYQRLDGTAYMEV